MRNTVVFSVVSPPLYYLPAWVTKININLVLVKKPYSTECRLLYADVFNDIYDIYVYCKHDMQPNDMFIVNLVFRKIYHIVFLCTSRSFER